jgi:hypothetical protein
MSVNIYNTENLPVPVKIIVEARNSSRVALGKNEIIVRLPKHISVADKEKTLKQFLVWARQQIEEKKYYHEHQHTVEYYQGRILKIYGKEFKTEIEFTATGKNKLSYRGDATLKIYLLENQPHKKQILEIQRFLLRFTEKYFLPELQKRTLYWNDIYFKERIEKVDVKHTISRWGSCSSSRKISFATKLLLLPQIIIDYVIIHELAHLKEMNHSPKFWKHVENVMPDYKTHRKWLQQNGSKIHF